MEEINKRFYRVNELIETIKKIKLTIDEITDINDILRLSLTTISQDGIELKNKFRDAVVNNGMDLNRAANILLKSYKQELEKEFQLLVKTVREEADKKMDIEIEKDFYSKLSDFKDKIDNIFSNQVLKERANHYLENYVDLINNIIKVLRSGDINMSLNYIFRNLLNNKTHMLKVKNLLNNLIILLEDKDSKNKEVNLDLTISILDILSTDGSIKANLKYLMFDSKIDLNKSIKIDNPLLDLNNLLEANLIELRNLDTLLKELKENIEKNKELCIDKIIELIEKLISDFNNSEGEDVIKYYVILNNYLLKTDSSPITIYLNSRSFIETYLKYLKENTKEEVENLKQTLERIYI